jgi:hypothetical protein
MELETARESTDGWTRLDLPVPADVGADAYRHLTASDMSFSMLFACT